MTSIKDCNTIVQDFKSSDPKLKLLLANLDKEKWNIECHSCGTTGIERNARAYITIEPEVVVLCANRLATKQAIQESLHHEAIHAFDYTHKRCDFSTCEGLAYTEIRAARDAECSGWYAFEWLRNSCIKSTATNATKNLYPNGASKCVNAAFEKAVLDLHPLPNSVLNDSSDTSGATK